MLIEDDPSVAEDLKILLPGHIEIEWVSNSRTAIERLKQGTRFDAVILDLCLPCYLSDSEREEGLRLLSLLAQEIAKDSPIVVLSSLPVAEVEADCLNRGARAYLEKPCNIRELVRLLDSLVSSDA
jgi:two-component system phosphate regulon response regulator PhoB